MKIFLDTNIILEGILRRNYAAQSDKLMAAIVAGQIEGFISVGSFHTITYFAEKQLRQKYFDKTERLQHLRSLLNNLLTYLTVVCQGNNDLAIGVNDKSFSDLEDSYQYQAAKLKNCRFLVTINTKDFPSDGPIAVMHLETFVNKFHV